MSVCNISGCYAFGKYCRRPGHIAETFKPATKLGKESDSMKEALKAYKIEAKKYITAHPICQFKGCRTPAQHIHHKAGRIGDLLTDKTYFMSVCADHHRWIEEHPAESKKEGYSVDRLTVKEA